MTRPSPKKPKLLDQFAADLRARDLAPATVKLYRHWARRFIVFHDLRHPVEMGVPEVRAFLLHLASDLCCSPVTQNQACNAIRALYRHMGRDLCAEGRLPTAKRAHRLPTIVSEADVLALLRELPGEYRLMGGLVYGSALRPVEVLRLRIGDIDRDRMAIAVRDRRGRPSRETVLPAALLEPVCSQIALAADQYRIDLAAGYGHVVRPDRQALSKQWPWQWLFAAKRRYQDPATGRMVRHHRHETALQRAIRAARRRLGLVPQVSAHHLRSAAAVALSADYDVRTVQEVLGHKDVRTTLRLVQAARLAPPIKSPLDKPP